MIQVQEQLQLTDGRIDAAIERLQAVFSLFATQPGFIDAAAGRGIDDPEKVIVLHSWETLEDWLNCKESPQKQAFSATRPDELYVFVPIGVNWQLDQTAGSITDATYVRRTVCREGAGPAVGNAAGCRMGSYVGDDVRYQGATLQLAFYKDFETYRAARVPVGRRARAFIADEAYELLASRYAPRDVMQSSQRA